MKQLVADLITSSFESSFPLGLFIHHLFIY